MLVFQRTFDSPRGWSGVLVKEIIDEEGIYIHNVSDALFIVHAVA